MCKGALKKKNQPHISCVIVGNSSSKISSHESLFHGTKWRQWYPHKESPTLHQKCRTEVKTRRGRATDLWGCSARARWILVHPLHAYIESIFWVCTETRLIIHQSSLSLNKGGHSATVWNCISHGSFSCDTTYYSSIWRKTNTARLYHMWKQKTGSEDILVGI